jgi:hypothetical protein
MKRICLKCICAGVLAQACFAAEVEPRLDVVFDDANGGVKSVTVAGDQDAMNWVEGLGEWGTPSPSMRLDFVSAKTSGSVQTAIWTNQALRLDVRREVCGGTLSERYVFTAISRHPVYFGRGDVGIYATFNDNYEDALTSQRKRCHAHIWCGGAFGGVRALKMGLFPVELGLFLEEGTLDSYSVQRIKWQYSNDRGDFILHPEPFYLNPGESKAISWKLSAYPAGGFREAALASGPSAVLIDFENETVFTGERFRLSATCAEAITSCKVTVNGKAVSAKVEGSRVVVDFRPEFRGTANFIFELNGRRHRAVGYVADDFRTLVGRRVDTILRENQCLDENSPLNGAFILYDNEESHQYYGYRYGDHNAARERVGMGLLLARWAQKCPSPEVMKALERYEAFLLREIWDETTGEVYNEIGLREKRKRHYNGPWYINFWWEMYNLTGKAIYLDRIEKGIRRYYEKAGSSFYPIACNYGECIATLKKAGRDTSELERLLRAHVDVMLAKENGYPSQEVRFEQTLVTPPTTVLSGYAEYVKRDPAILSAISNHIAVLKRFDGNAPDHRLAGIPIRHWDGYWFGKERLFGDSMPHYWSCLSAFDYGFFARLSGDKDYFRRAERIFRNLLCLYFPNGKASCAYIYPFSVTMVDKKGKVLEQARRGERFDPWANDQDYGLYYALREGVFDGMDPMELKNDDDWTVSCSDRPNEKVTVNLALAGATIRGSWEEVPRDIADVWDGNDRWCHFSRRTVANRVEPTSYVRIPWRKGLKIRVAAKNRSSKLEVLPRGGALHATGMGEVEIAPEGPCKLIVSADGDMTKRALSVFVESEVALPDWSAWKKVIRFTPGWHDVENDVRIVLNSHGMPVVDGVCDDTLVWLDEGARVCAAIDVNGAKRVKIAGPGTIDLYSRSQGYDRQFRGGNLWGVAKDWELPAVWIHNGAEDVAVEDVVMLCSFRGICVRNAKRLSFRDVKIFTHACSGDGINVVNLQGLVARDMFVHSQDDPFCAYSNYDSYHYLWDGNAAVKERRTGDLLVEDSLLWTACRPLVFCGHGTNNREQPDLLENVTVRRCVIFPTMGCALPPENPLAGGSGVIRILNQSGVYGRKMRFEDLEIDWTKGFVSRLLHLEVRSKETASFGEGDGYRVEDVLFRNIRCLGVPDKVAKSIQQIRIANPREGTGFFNIRTENITYDGEPVDPFSNDFIRGR